MKIFLHKPGVIDVLIKRAKIIYQHRNQPINHINPYHRRAKTMNKNAGKNNVPLVSQILDYYSTAEKYIRSDRHTNAHQTVFTKESDRYQ